MKEIKVRQHNNKQQDSIIIEGETIKEIRRVAKKAMFKRGWVVEDCYSEEITNEE